MDWKMVTGNPQVKFFIKKKKHGFSEFSGVDFPFPSDSNGFSARCHNQRSQGVGDDGQLRLRLEVREEAEPRRRDWGHPKMKSAGF